MNLKFDGEISV